MSIYLVKYICPETDQYRWLEESMSMVLAQKLCEQLARDGRKPILYCVTVNPSWLLSCDSKHREFVFG